MTKSLFKFAETEGGTVRVEGDGVIEGYFSIFGSVDLVGDVVEPDAFDATLADYKARGARIPVCVDHSWGTGGDGVVGFCEPWDIVADKTGKLHGKRGLWARVKLFIDDSPAAAFAYKLVKTFDGTLQSSFAYDVPKGGERRGRDGANHLFVLDLIELSLCLKGAHPGTSLGIPKSALQALVSLTPDERTELRLDFKTRGIQSQLAKALRLMDDGAPTTAAEVGILDDISLLKSTAEFDAIKHRMRMKGMDVSALEDDDEDIKQLKCPDCGKFVGEPVQHAPGGYHAVACPCGAVIFREEDLKGVPQWQVDRETRWLMNKTFPKLWDANGHRKGSSVPSYVPTAWPTRSREEERARFRKERTILVCLHARKDLAAIDAARVKDEARRDLAEMERSLRRAKQAEARADIAAMTK